VDLVCQISSPHRNATLLQREGRSGHTITGVPKGRIFPLTRDDLVECAAMVRAVHDGELDRVAVPDKPLDVLAQQIVAEAGSKVLITPGFMKSRIRRRSQLRYTRRGTVRKGFGAGETVRVRAGVFRVPYVVPTEYGTSRHPPQPFIRPALQNNQTTVVNEFAARMRRRINSAARRLRKGK
jgi:HK97 gp10 family phage protein